MVDKKLKTDVSLRENKNIANFASILFAPNLGRKEGRNDGTCLFDINIKHNTEIFIGKIISGDSH